MVRVMNFLCMALMGLSILALYHVSERTRVARLDLNKVNSQINRAHSDIAVLEAEWQHVASPARIQQLAQSRLGMSDTASAQLSSFTLLPRRGESAPPGNSPLRNANAVLPAPARAHAIAVSAPGSSVPGGSVSGASVPGM